MDVEIIKLNGSVELGPIIGLSDIVDIESGRTLGKMDCGFRGDMPHNSSIGCESGEFKD